MVYAQVEQTCEECGHELPSPKFYFADEAHTILTVTCPECGATYE